MMNPFRFFPAAWAGEWSMNVLNKDHKTVPPAASRQGEVFASVPRPPPRQKLLKLLIFIHKKLSAHLLSAIQPSYFAAFYNGT
jgi:hypothetical protein